jgi:hypothetical protein
MIKVEFSENFKKITKSCVDNDAYIGLGNPNAKILFVGQESALEKREERYDNNASEWKNHIINSTSQVLNYDVDENHPLRKYWGKNTWSKYQKLSEFIFQKEVKPFYVDFLENIFTTEMSDNPSKRTSEAQKKKDFKLNLQIRKDTFFKEGFIQDFPVVVLACSGYIQNNEKLREIDDIFKVSYPVDTNGKPNDEIGKHWYNKTNWFYLHYNDDKTKLVIHTRQLSNDVVGQMLKDMGKIIREHLKLK